jgi:predicted nucleic acid-binding protein
MAYWDTSCLVKLFVPEPDSPRFRAHVVGGATVVTSQIARLELWATVRRKEASGDIIRGGAREVLRAYIADVDAGLIMVGAVDSAVDAKFEAFIEQCYSFTPPIPLRTLDAIHLSTAFVLGESQIVATDSRLREAASKVGFSIYPPP